MTIKKKHCVLQNEDTLYSMKKVKYIYIVSCSITEALHVLGAVQMLRLLHVQIHYFQRQARSHCIYYDVPVFSGTSAVRRGGKISTFSNAESAPQVD